MDIGKTIICLFGNIFPKQCCAIVKDHFLYRMTMDKNKIERCTCMLIIQNKKTIFGRE